MACPSESECSYKLDERIIGQGENTDIGSLMLSIGLENFAELKQEVFFPCYEWFITQQSTGGEEPYIFLPGLRS